MPSLYCFSVGFRAGAPVHLHTHEEHEFFLCTDGTGGQHTSREEYTMRKGDLFFFPAGQEHIGSCPAGGRCLGIVVNLAPGEFASEIGEDEAILRVLRYLTNRAEADKNRVELSPKGIRLVRRLLQEMVEETLQKSSAYECAVRLKMQEALLAILRDERVLPDIRRYVRPSSAEDRLADVLRYIDRNYMVPIDVQHMAKRACLSRSQFHAVFKRQIGRTLIQFVNEVRVRAARRLLREGAESVLNVAYGCGFASLSQFYHVFRNVTGCPPRRYADLEERTLHAPASTVAQSRDVLGGNSLNVRTAVQKDSAG